MPPSPTDPERHVVDWSRPPSMPPPAPTEQEEAGAQSAADAGVVANPEVPGPNALDVTSTTGETTDRPTTTHADPGGAIYTPPAPWDLSGYSPPAPIRLDENSPPPVFRGDAYPGMGTATGIFSPPPPFAPSPAVAVPATTSAPAMVSTRAAEGSGRRSKVQLRTSLTILLFIVGLTAGVVGLRLANPTRTQTPDAFPTLDRTAIQPAQAGAVAQELAQNDVHGLAQLLDSDTLTAIQTELKPLVTFESVTFVGATTRDKETIAGYVVRGRDQDGNLGLVGLVMRLRDGQVVVQ